MIVRHATPFRNVPSIDSEGLLPSRSRGASQVVWLHTPSLTYWSIQHVCDRHDVTPDAVAVLTVFVPRSWLRRSKAGVYYCDRPIPPGRIAGSPDWFAREVVSGRSPGPFGHVILADEGDPDSLIF